MNQNKKNIIVFSGKQFSGKDTAAKILLKNELFHSFKRIGIADAIKFMYAKNNHLDIEEIEKNKSKYRQDLIDLGNWGRSQDNDYWLKTILNYDGNVIVTDIRVKHELNVFKNNGAFTVRVEASRDIRAKRGIITSSDDNTETDLDNITDWDYILFNNGSLDDLKENTDKLILEIRKKLMI